MRLYSIINGRGFFFHRDCRVLLLDVVFFPNATVEYYYWTWIFSHRDCRVLLLDVVFSQRDCTVLLLDVDFFPNACLDYY